MSTSVPERRVGEILKRSFPYVYKPVDGRHAGPTKIDYLCCDSEGFFLGVEVKATSNREFYNPNVRGAKGISAGQRNALDAIVQSACGKAYVVVAANEEEYLMYDWKEVKSLSRWKFTEAEAVLHPKDRSFYCVVK